jgi:hypothetical protein
MLLARFFETPRIDYPVSQKKEVLDHTYVVCLRLAATKSAICTWYKYLAVSWLSVSHNYCLNSIVRLVYPLCILEQIWLRRCLSSCKKSDTETSEPILFGGRGVSSVCIRIAWCGVQVSQDHSVSLFPLWLQTDICRWTLKFGILPYIDWYIVTGVSKEHSVSVFTVKQSKNTLFKCLTGTVKILGSFETSENI